MKNTAIIIISIIFSLVASILHGASLYIFSDVFILPAGKFDWNEIKLKTYAIYFVLFIIYVIALYSLSVSNSYKHKITARYIIMFYIWAALPAVCQWNIGHSDGYGFDIPNEIIIIAPSILCIPFEYGWILTTIIWLTLVIFYEKRCNHNFCQACLLKASTLIIFFACITTAIIFLLKGKPYI